MVLTGYRARMLVAFMAAQLFSYGCRAPRESATNEVDVEVADLVPEDQGLSRDAFVLEEVDEYHSDVAQVWTDSVMVDAELDCSDPVSESLPTNGQPCDEAEVDMFACGQSVDGVYWGFTGNTPMCKRLARLVCSKSESGGNVWQPASCSTTSSPGCTSAQAQCFSAIGNDFCASITCRWQHPKGTSGQFFPCRSDLEGVSSCPLDGTGGYAVECMRPFNWNPENDLSNHFPSKADFDSGSCRSSCEGGYYWMPTVACTTVQCLANGIKDVPSSCIMDQGKARCKNCEELGYQAMPDP